MTFKGDTIVGKPTLVMIEKAKRNARKENK